MDCNGSKKYTEDKHLLSTGTSSSILFLLFLLFFLNGRKSVEDQQRKIQDKKDRVRLAVEENRLLDTDLKRDALELQVQRAGLLLSLSHVCCGPHGLGM